MQLIIRRARPDDLAAIVALLDEARAWLASRHSDQWQEPVTGRRQERVVQAIDAGQVWVVEPRGAKVVATITVDGRADPEFWTADDAPDDAVYAHRMAVARGQAGQQLGSTLLDFAGRIATRAGKRWVRLDAWATNEGLQDYYRSQGFQHVRTCRYTHRGSGALFQRDARLQLRRGPTLTALDPIEQ